LLHVHAQAQLQSAKAEADKAAAAALADSEEQLCVSRQEVDTLGQLALALKQMLEEKAQELQELQVPGTQWGPT
jgi:hypothetical protein